MAEQHGKLEAGLLQAMKAIDNQIARAMQRSPAEREVHGVQKWEPYATRIEAIAGFLLEEIGETSVGIDSLLVCTQAFAKALQLVCDELGPDGLGEVRSSYCLDAMRHVTRDAQLVIENLSEQPMV